MAPIPIFLDRPLRPTEDNAIKPNQKDWNGVKEESSSTTPNKSTQSRDGIPWSGTAISHPGPARIKPDSSVSFPESWKAPTVLPTTGPENPEIAQSVLHSNNNIKSHKRHQSLLYMPSPAANGINEQRRHSLAHPPNYIQNPYVDSTSEQRAKQDHPFEQEKLEDGGVLNEVGRWMGKIGNKLVEAEEQAWKWAKGRK